PLRIGSRGSILARWQAEFVRKQLFQVSGVEAEIVIIKTSGDKMQQAPLTQIGGKGIFIKELEEALLEETVDLAVHSVKDIPTETPRRLHFPAVCRRDDVRDCLVSHKGAALANLKQGARVGTSSLRRQAQLRHHRPDLDIRELRGNVDTRLRKVESGEYDAIVLSKAGLDRLGWGQKITEALSPEISLPAVGQGAIAIEARVNDTEAADILGKLDDAETRTACRFAGWLPGAPRRVGAHRTRRTRDGCGGLLRGWRTVCSTAGHGSTGSGRATRRAHGQAADRKRRPRHSGRGATFPWLNPPPTLFWASAS